MGYEWNLTVSSMILDYRTYDIYWVYSRPLESVGNTKGKDSGRGSRSDSPYFETVANSNITEMDN